MDAMFDYIAGVVTMGYLLAGLFFLRFWRRTKDGLFVVFAVAFWLLALNQALATLSGIPREELSWVYLLRLAAFTLIIGAIVRKNLRSAPRS
jgi:asparagine N-glycosylation enzyme membrane subunit Stt3